MVERRSRIRVTHSFVEELFATSFCHTNYCIVFSTSAKQQNFGDYSPILLDCVPSGRPKAFLRSTRAVLHVGPLSTNLSSTIGVAESFFIQMPQFGKSFLSASSKRSKIGRRRENKFRKLSFQNLLSSFSDFVSFFVFNLVVRIHAQCSYSIRSYLSWIASCLPRSGSQDRLLEWNLCKR